MNYEVIEALEKIVREKGMEREFVIQTLKDGLLSAAKKKYGNVDNIEVVLDEDSGEITMHAAKTVAETVADPILEISLEEARGIKKKAEIGDIVKVEIPLSEFGRMAIQAAKQILFQRIREAEREQIYSDFQNRVGDVVSGMVQHVDRGDLIINLGRADGILPLKEQIRSERHRQGDTIRACILAIQKTPREPQIALSRTHPDFLKRLFHLEVPEISEGLVEIKAVARDPGDRAKIAVISRDERVDPVGACVGLKGSRVQAIVRELSGERIDIIQFSSDIGTFVTRALAPAKEMQAHVNEAEKSVTVVAPEEQLSLAIGKKGQNTRLASRLTGYHIDLIGAKDFAKRQTAVNALQVQIKALKLGPKLKEKLLAAGYETAQALVEAGAEALTGIAGIGDKTAVKIFSVAQKAVAEKQTELVPKKEKKKAKKKVAEKGRDKKKKESS
jgi:N utilization substance protein A